MIQKDAEFIQQDEKTMKPGFDVKMTKEEINKFPLASYMGTVKIVRSLEDAKSAVTLLSGEKVLGFDKHFAEHGFDVMNENALQ